MDEILNGEVDWLPASSVTPDIIEAADQLAELGWLFFECGCLVGPEGRSLHAVHESEAP